MGMAENGVAARLAVKSDHNRLFAIRRAADGYTAQLDDAEIPVSINTGGVIRTPLIPHHHTMGGNGTSGWASRPWVRAATRRNVFCRVLR